MTYWLVLTWYGAINSMVIVPQPLLTIEECKIMGEQWKQSGTNPLGKDYACLPR